MDIEPSDSPGDSANPPGAGQEWVAPAAGHQSGAGAPAGLPVWFETTGGILPPLAPPPPPRRRRKILPLVLFLAIWPMLLAPDDPAITLSAEFQRRWPSGLAYMSAVMAILFAHEMGHFLQAVRYKVPASLPFFIPMPLPPIGTMGAVIAMPSSRANRLQLFDIGISGPLAGLILAIPVAWFGIQSASIAPLAPDGKEGGGMYFQDPLIFKALIHFLRPELQAGEDLVLNPLLLAGWVGMLITGLNMLPISQLDGGHVSYALFGRRPAHALAWLMVAAAIVFIVYSGRYEWMLMLALVVYIGPAHPPTADDYVPLGWGRRLIGLASLLIPVFCFVPTPIRTV
jgi:Zn-dependent protease